MFDLVTEVRSIGERVFSVELEGRHPKVTKLLQRRQRDKYCQQAPRPGQVIPQDIRDKPLRDDHNVKEDEVRECFFNHDGFYLEDDNEDHEWQRIKNVHDPHHDVIHATAEITRRRAIKHPNKQRHCGGGEAHQQRHTPTV